MEEALREFIGSCDCKYTIFALNIFRVTLEGLEELKGKREEEPLTAMKNFLEVRGLKS